MSPGFNHANIFTVISLTPLIHSYTEDGCSEDALNQQVSLADGPAGFSPFAQNIFDSLGESQNSGGAFSFSQVQQQPTDTRFQIRAVSCHKVSVPVMLH